MEDTKKVNAKDDETKSDQEFKPGPISQLLNQKGLNHVANKNDHIGIEIINVKPQNLIEIVHFLKSNGFNYLQCQGGYDEGPGQNLVSFYHLIAMMIDSYQ